MSVLQPWCMRVCERVGSAAWFDAQAVRKLVCMSFSAWWFFPFTLL